MAITFRTSLGAALTHAQMDENFSSVYFSSSIHDTLTTAKELRLWFDNDTAPLTYDSVILPAPGGTGTVTIDQDGDNRLVTAKGDGSIQGEPNFTFDGDILGLVGRFEPIDSTGNISIGANAGISATSGDNILIGSSTGQNLQGSDNLAVGNASLINAIDNSNTAIGNSSLINLYTGVGNTTLGYLTAENVDNGSGNVYIGNEAGPATAGTSQNNKLYINNTPSNTPLILGDFATGQVTFNSQVSASVFSGSFVGNGAGLTGVSTEWDGSRNGNAEITGSLIVSGGVGSKVDFTKVGAISGSNFSGSFAGDGSQLTGITSTSEWDGSRNGNAEITGSFIVSGSSPTINLKGVTTIHTNVKIHNPSDTSIGIGTGTLIYTQASSVAVGYQAGAIANNQTVTIGRSAGSRAGDESTYVGYIAGGGNNGKYNTGIGSQVLAKSQYTDYETALGYRALFAVKQGFANVSLGAESFSALEEGAYNTVAGTGAFRNLRIGTGNVALGYEAGSPNLKEGHNNVYLGVRTGRADITEESSQLYIDNTTRNDALIRGDFAQRILTLNAIQIFLPGLLNESDQSPANLAAIDALPSGALYKSWDLIVAKP